MCILFLLIGDNTRPTIICNNRDEYFVRETIRGTLSEDGNNYSPVDKVGGGSWLSFKNLNNSKNLLKFAVVLNYHFWRQENVKPLENEELLLSRGLLIKNFIENDDISSIEYAEHVFNDRMKYRPFNLIIGDMYGSYYVTSDMRQSKPRVLVSGTVYGLSNGYMDDMWLKVTHGVTIMQESILPQYAKLITAPKLENICQNLTQFSNTLLSSLLQVDTPLNDPLLGDKTTAITTLGAIFVNPCLIYRQKAIVNSGTAEQPEEVTWDEATIKAAYEQRLAGVLKACQILPTDYKLDGSNSNDHPTIRRENIFGTRTSTVFVIFPSEAFVQSDEDCDEIKETPNNHYCIVENDFNASSNSWSVNTICN